MSVSEYANNLAWGIAGMAIGHHVVGPMILRLFPLEAMYLGIQVTNAFSWITRRF